MTAFAMSDDATPEPGAPMGRDAIDPELVNLRRAPTPLGLVSALGVVVLCIAMLVRLRHDFAYSRQGAAQASAAAEIAAGKVADNRHVTLDAPADRAGAVRLFVTRGSLGSRVVAVRGTADRLWLALPGDPWGSAVHHDDRVTGRLRRLSDLRYAGPLAATLKQHPVPRFISGVELRRAKAAATTQLTLLDGSPLTIAPTDELDLDLVDPGAAIVVATISTSFPDAAAWSAPLAQAGVITAGQAPISTSATTARWLVQRPDAVAAMTTALDAAALWGARAEPSTVTQRAPWASTTVSDAGVTVGTSLVPWSAIDVVGVWAPRPVPDGAWIVLADEAPGDYWYLMPIYIGLVLIGLLALWALIRAVKRALTDRAVVAK